MLLETFFSSPSDFWEMPAYHRGGLSPACGPLDRNWSEFERAHPKVAAKVCSPRTKMVIFGLFEMARMIDGAVKNNSVMLARVLT